MLVSNLWLAWLTARLWGKKSQAEKYCEERREKAVAPKRSKSTLRLKTPTNQQQHKTKTSVLVDRKEVACGISVVKKKSSKRRNFGEILQEKDK